MEIGQDVASHRPGEPDARVVRFTAADGLTVAALLAAAVVLGRRYFEIGFLGWDTYAILAANRLESVGDFLGILGQPMAGGLLPMSFYRPLLSLSVALEWQLWGLTAGGYVAMNAALFGLCGLALYALVLRFGGSRPAAFTAVAFAVLHPVVADVVPYLPRRPELLCTLFVLLALQLDHRGRFAPSRSSIAGAWLATAAAAGAKETAIALPVLIAAARWLFPAPRHTARRHTAPRHTAPRHTAPRHTAPRQAIRGFTAHTAVLAVVLLLRFRVLGGAGGYPDTDLTGLPRLWAHTLAKTLLGVFLPAQAEMLLSLIGFAVLVLAAARLAVLRPAVRRPAVLRPAVLARLGPGRLRLLAFASVWILTFATVYSAAARLSPWYLLIVVCGGAVGFGVVLDLALSAVRTAAPGRLAGAALLLASALLLAGFAAGSPLFRPQEEFHQATRDSTVFLEDLEQRIRQAPGGGRIEVGPYPRLTVGTDGRQVPTLVPRSLPGWARIVFPRRDIEFVSKDDAGAEPHAPEVTVVVLGHGIHRSTPRAN